MELKSLKIAIVMISKEHEQVIMIYKEKYSEIPLFLMNLFWYVCVVFKHSMDKFISKIFFSNLLMLVKFLSFITIY